MMGPNSGGLTDLHSHLVPGVDDGARTVGEAMEGIETLVSAGIQRIVTTPHINGSITRDRAALAARMDEMDRSWASLLEEAKGKFPGLELQRGNEVMLDIPDPDLSDPRLRIHDTSFVLVEWPGLHVPPGTLPALVGLIEAGIKPIIAHPERYGGMDWEMALPGEWRRVGAYLQVNYGSLIGRYGDGPRKRAVELLARGWVDLFSTDYHGRPGISPSVQEARDALSTVGGREQFHILAVENPTRILGGEDPLPAPTLSLPKGFWRRLKSAFRV
jgi:protein-tyrosine phosphatase